MNLTMSSKRTFDGKVYHLVAVATKKVIQDYAKRQRRYGKLVRVTHEKSHKGDKWVAWQVPDRNIIGW